MYLLDTMVISEFPKRKRNLKVIRWLASRRPEDMHVSVISLGEIRRGIVLQNRRNPEFANHLQKWLDGFCKVYSKNLLPISKEIAIAFGDISASVGSSGIDNIIAATAQVHRLTVVTRNIKHFQQTGVPCVNPWENP